MTLCNSFYLKKLVRLTDAAIGMLKMKRPGK